MSDETAPVKVEDISPVKKKLSFDISWVDVKKELDAAYRDMGKKAKVKGFRPGKIPRKILETLYKDNVEEEAISNLVNKYYWDAIKENGISVVSQPDIDQNGIEEEKNFTFSANVEVEPVIEPNDYTGLELEREDKEVTESDIEARLQQIRQMFGTMEEIVIDREVKEGDFTTIDFIGSHDGESLKELTAENYPLEIGSGMFVPGFEEQLIGMRKGESRKIKVTFPEDYRMKRVAGKEVEFTVTLKSLKEKILPEINEDFIRNFEKYETLEDLRKDIKKTIEEENKAQSDAALRNLILSKLLDKNEFEVPASYIERQIHYMMEDTRSKMASRGLNIKDIDKLSDTYKDMYREEATKVVKSILLMKSIAAKESLSIDDKEINERVMEMAHRRKQDFNSFKKSLEEADIIESIKNEILNKKVFEFIEAKSQIRLVRTEDSQNGGQ